ncbi:hypothetical protein EJ05DRAFT_473728 [Pseudovirgaria hyperparasitica]|uniref:FAD-binding FR-type domain-containing protein n=1 Tax=Pseudovirgaria hyperparasitica TaxID=470096 RepID=A0A6A6WF68_9PEZI|nr:uncharacterized protein EJ05DRAFT_473728 [Pseudovirgaria hyperparasitica]KAF2761185.1 hypothetical protein EJ05DRAFT_473728 [Pseudovirgaria hyperparasitica]
MDSHDNERKPLLGISATKKPRIKNKIKAWAMYQPANIPYFDKVLPSNLTSLAIILFLAINIFYAVYRIPFRLDLFFVFADRLGLIFVANLPFLYLFGAKNQPIRWLTGISYESLNIWHRRLGELMCLTALLHFLGMIIVWYIDLRPEGFTLLRFISTNLVILGLGAFISYETLYVTSLSSFRQRWYELFLASHIVFQALALLFAYFHFPTAQIYVLASVLIFLTDRILFRLTLKRTTITASLTILPDVHTLLISANWHLPPTTPFLHANISHGWAPTDHVFVTIPALSRSAALQAHPFTIFSAAPTSTSTTASSHAWLTLLVRARAGFSASLLAYARTHSSVRMRVDGPYGSPHALDVLESADSAILVVGGSGIAVAYPLLYALLHPRHCDAENVLALSGSNGENRRRRVRLLWVVHSEKHAEWLPKEKMEELVAWGLEVAVPAATERAGRPDVVGIVGHWVAQEDGRTGVVVSGPDGMNRDVRNACAGMVGMGRDVRVCVEKFGW